MTHKTFRAFLTNGRRGRYASASQYATLDEALAAGRKVASRLGDDWRVSCIFDRGQRIEVAE